MEDRGDLNPTPAPLPTMAVIPPRPASEPIPEPRAPAVTEGSVEATAVTASTADVPNEATLASISLVSDDANPWNQTANPPSHVETSPPSSVVPESTPEDTSNDAAIAASLAAADFEASSVPHAPLLSTTLNATHTANATMSAAWQADTWYTHCHGCREAFHVVFNRRHHCRYCGHVFCQACSNLKALIPPSRIVLQPKGAAAAAAGTASVAPAQSHAADADYPHVSFSPDPDPDRLITYTSHATAAAPSASSVGEPEVVLYGKGLEERYQLAREPLRVCRPCYTTLQPLQHSLRWHNSHAMRYNAIDPTHIRRHWNSPIAHTLGHEIRKAAYTLNNLLPQPKRRVGALVDFYDIHGGAPSVWQSELQQCRDTCSNVNPNLADLDGVKIPATLLEQAKGVAVMTVMKGGFGLAGVELGTGLVVARIPSGGAEARSDPTASLQWSAPSAIGTAGVSWGALLGAQVSDHVFLLMTDAAVQVLFHNTASVQLGADIGVAVGPVGRSVEGDWAFGDHGPNGPSNHPFTAPIYTYSMSKGLYAGVSLDGKVIVTRPEVNEKFYGHAVTASDILAGVVPTPPAAQPLYEALQRCHVYATAAAAANGVAPPRRPIPQSWEQEYGELPDGASLPPLAPGATSMSKREN